MARELDVYVHRHFVGRLKQDDSGQLAFAYDQEWLSRSESTPISQSLPLQREPFSQVECRPFFSGILPEGEVRQAIARVLRITPRNDFVLLERIGGECAGAVTFVPAGSDPPAAPTNEDYRILSEEELQSILEDLPTRPLLAGEAGIRLSLAGAQNKLPLRMVNGALAVPLHGAPSSHIVKPAISGFQDTVLNEAMCLATARRLGLNAARASIRRIGGGVVLVIERYDRVQSANGILERLHQEDFCQALGIPTELKYQSEGGPALQDCFELVRECTARPAVELARLLDAVVFNFLIGNRDAHGKNFSLLYGPEGAGLAPLYDILSTAVYPSLSESLAMKIGGNYEAKGVHLRHWEAFARESGLAAPLARRRISEMAGRLPSVVREVAGEFSEEGHASPVLDEIVDVVDRHCSSFLGK